MPPEVEFRVGRGGYFYSPDRAEIVEASKGDVLPKADHWEYIGTAEELTPADAVAVVEERYPDVSVELTLRRL